MNPTFNVPIVCSLLIFAILIIPILTPVCAASTDIKLPYSGSVTDSGFIATDGQFIAISKAGSSAPELAIYTVDMKQYATVPLSSDTLKAVGMADGRLFYADAGGVFEYTIQTGKKRLIDSTTKPIDKIVADGDNVVLGCDDPPQNVVLISLSKGTNDTVFTSRDWIHGLAIDGDRIMWGCERVDKGPGREIHVYTISTGTDYIIPESKSENTYGYGDISGDNVVWAMRAKDPDYINGVPVGGVSYDMRLTNLVSGRTQSVDRSDTAPLTVPFISGDTIAYLKQPSLDYNNYETGVIRTYNIRTGTFKEFGSKIAFLHAVKGDLIIWGRYSPMSFFATSLNGTLPVVTSLTPTQSATQIPGTIPENTPTPVSPVSPIAVVSALAAGVAGYAVLHKRR